MDTFLDGLAHARIYPYQGKDNILAIVQQELAHSSDSEYVDFSHVDTTAFADLAREANDDIIPTMIKDYSRLQNLLVIKVTASGSHEQLYNRLAQLINNQVLLMGLDGQLRQMGSTQVDTHPEGRDQTSPSIRGSSRKGVLTSGPRLLLRLVIPSPCPNCKPTPSFGSRSPEGMLRSFLSQRLIGLSDVSFCKNGSQSRAPVRAKLWLASHEISPYRRGLLTKRGPWW